MYEEKKYQIQGVAPILLHNVQMADPLSEISKLIKEVSSKRKKTEADHAELARLEWYGGLYLDKDKHIVIPGENIESMLVAAAKKNKLGSQFKAAIYSDGNWPLIYDGPKDIDKLWDCGKFINKTSVKIQQARIIRTRPMFSNWQLKFSVHYLSDTIDVKQLNEAVVIAGRIIGLCDWRPRFGRFEVI